MPKPNIPTFEGETGSERVRELIAANEDALRSGDLTISRITQIVQQSGVACSKATASKWFHQWKKANAASDHGATVIAEDGTEQPITAIFANGGTTNPEPDAAAVVTASPSCPKCGAPMVVRKAKRGALAGKEFYGCRKYPRCRGTRKLTGVEGTVPVAANSHEDQPATEAPSQPSLPNANATGAAAGVGVAVAAAVEAALKEVGVDEERVNQLIDSRTANSDQIKELIRDAIAAERMRPRIKRVSLEVIGEDARKKIDVGEQSHPMLAEALRLYYAGVRNLWFCGPAGSGKTTLAKQIADHIGQPFGTINCTAGMGESQLLGRLIPNLTTGEGGYLESAFVACYERGGVFLADEFDAADPNVVLALNTATANGRCPIPNRMANPIAKRHENSVIIIATNTWGAGADADYSGRDVIDAAVRDRYAMSKLFVGYSHELECELFGDFTREAKGDGFEAWVAPAYLAGLDWRGVFERIRANIGKHHLRATVSTRAKANAYMLAEAGYSTRELVTIFMQDWSPQMRAKGLEGVDAS